MYHIGIDIGSTYTKYCIVDSNKRIQDTYCERTPIRQKEYFEEKRHILSNEYFDAQVISCGYGKKNVMAVRNVSELSALARGSYYMMPEQNIVLDIGGQDTKIIIHESGKLKGFFVNEKCAAGCGMFLMNILNLLKMSFSDIDLSEIERPEISLSSVCAVFAQSEIIELLAADCPPKTILQAVVWQILIQAKMLLSKVKCNQIVLSGGMTQISGISSYAERALGCRVLIPTRAAYLSALGCAIMQFE